MELMVVMTLTLFVLAASSKILVALITQFKQQSKIAETSIESAVGLEALRYDLKTAGFGLFWNTSGGPYQEAASAPASNYNDTGSMPRAIVSGDNVAFTNVVSGSDYLVVKSALAGRNESSGASRNLAAGKWHTIVFIDSVVGTEINQWSAADENLASADRVIVVRFEPTMDNALTLVEAGGDFYTTFADLESGGSAFAPTSDEDNRLIYGLTEGGTPRMPFNRADYYVSTEDVPSRCAPGTGVLVKRILVNSTGAGGGQLDTPLPLLDCVADMQVVYAIDGGLPGGGGSPDGNFENGVGGDVYSDVLTGMDAEDIRERVAEVAIYILAHDGQYDPTYTYTSSTVTVGEHGAGRDLNLATAIGANWANYRWRVYRITERPTALRGR